ncbi:MAG: hypothetical protein ACR2RE_28575 [Geminicoccaceae bacterium]
MDMRKEKGNKTRAERPCYYLDKLCEQFTPGNQPESFDDPSVGNEEL